MPGPDYTQAECNHSWVLRKGEDRGSVSRESGLGWGPCSQGGALRPAAGSLLGTSLVLQLTPVIWADSLQQVWRKGGRSTPRLSNGCHSKPHLVSDFFIHLWYEKVVGEEVETGHNGACACCSMSPVMANSRRVLYAPATDTWINRCCVEKGLQCPELMEARVQHAVPCGKQMTIEGCLGRSKSGGEALNPSHFHSEVEELLMDTKLRTSVSAVRNLVPELSLWFVWHCSVKLSKIVMRVLKFSLRKKWLNVSVGS